MLHCDLKPENIMFDSNGVVKIIDFGSVRIAGIAELSSPIILDANAGTMGYTAPEVIIDAKVSRASDRFSLGVIVYEMLTGQLPYEDKLNKNLTKVKLAKMAYTTALIHNQNLPIWINGTLAKACALDEQKRYETLSGFLFDLENPNDEFIYKQQNINVQVLPRKYRLMLVGSIALNFVLLLLLIEALQKG
jgi:protein phosphatase